MSREIKHGCPKYNSGIGLGQILPFLKGEIGKKERVTRPKQVQNRMPWRWIIFNLRLCPLGPWGRGPASTSAELVAVSLDRSLC